MFESWNSTAYGEILLKQQAIFDIPISVSNIITGAMFYITTLGVVIVGETKDPKTGKRTIQQNLTKWDIVMVEPDASNDSPLIPFVNVALNRSYTMRFNKNNITDKIIEMDYVPKSFVDKVYSAGNITTIFKNQDERTQALKIWKKEKLYNSKETLSGADIEKKMAEEIIKNKNDFKKGLTRQQRKTAIQMIKDGELKYKEIKEGKPSGIADIIDKYNKKDTDDKKGQSKTSKSSSDHTGFVQKMSDGVVVIGKDGYPRGNPYSKYRNRNSTNNERYNRGIRKKRRIYGDSGNTLGGNPYSRSNPSGGR